MQSVLKNFDPENLPPDELSPAEIALLRQKLDRDRQLKWAAGLSKKGIRREPPVGLFYKKNWRDWAIAAALFAVFASALWLWNQPTAGSFSPKMAAGGNLPVFHFQGNLRGQNNMATDFSKAVKAYEAGNFAAARPLALAAEKLENGWKPAFLAGLCCIFDQKQPDFGAAISHFDRTISFADAPVEAKIYRAFALQKTGQTAAARAELEKLKDHPQLRGQFLDAVKRMLEK